MTVGHTHPSVRLTGRWDTSRPDRAVTTTTGAYVEFSFEGNMAVALFDTAENATPALHLWICVDGGAMIEAPIDNYLRIVAPSNGKHTVRITYKGGMEASSRWYAPLHGKVTFLGVVTDTPADLPADNRRVIEFVGDSITEGVLIDADFCRYGSFTYDVEHLNRVYQDDACATYAYLTANALDLRPVTMGYGAVGVTKSGQGKVPAAHEAYPYNFDGSPITREKPDIVVLNHGANDGRATPAEYLEKYALTLDVIREHNPDAVVVSLSAFCGHFHNELAEFIKEYNARNGCNVYYIDTHGWIPVSPLHPLRDGHKKVADNLVPLLDKIIKENFK